MSMQLLTPRSNRYEHKKRDKRLSQYANIRVAQRDAYQHRDKAQTTDTFLGIPCRQVTYQVPSKEEREKMRDQFIQKKGYRVTETEHGEILLPRFPLDMDETVTLGFKKVLFFNHITCEGIKTPK